MITPALTTDVERCYQRIVNAWSYSSYTDAFDSTEGDPNLHEVIKACVEEYGSETTFLAVACVKTRIALKDFA